MHALFINGTAGSGKSLLVSRLLEWYSKNGAYAASLNLDPGAINLPYKPDIDVRNYIDIGNIMESFDLGPNGALVLSSDMISSRIDEIQEEVDALNPDYLIIDTPGQVELFAYRVSGPLFVSEFRSDSKAAIFLFDSMLVSSAVNFVSIMLLATSISLRLRIPQINVLSKIDLVKDRKNILSWSSNPILLETALTNEDSELYLLTSSIVRAIVNRGFSAGLIAVSSATSEGMMNLMAALARIFKGGEEIED